MIQANELRIGNWYKTGYGHINQVTTVSKYNDLGLCKELAEPIPLTEEWLLKFGFEIDENYDDENYVKHSGRKSLMIGLDDGYGNIIFLFQEDVGCGFNDLASEIEHVHQLQNLYFALTGEELTKTNKE